MNPYCWTCQSQPRYAFCLDYIHYYNIIKFIITIFIKVICMLFYHTSPTEYQNLHSHCIYWSQSNLDDTWIFTETHEDGQPSLFISSWGRGIRVWGYRLDRVGLSRISDCMELKFLTQEQHNGLMTIILYLRFL